MLALYVVTVRRPHGQIYSSTTVEGRSSAAKAFDAYLQISPKGFTVTLSSTTPEQEEIA